MSPKNNILFSWSIGIQHWTSISAILHNFLLHAIVEGYFFMKSLALFSAHCMSIADKYFVFLKNIWTHWTVLYGAQQKTSHTSHFTKLGTLASHKPFHISVWSLNQLKIHSVYYCYMCIHYSVYALHILNLLCDFECFVLCCLYVIREYVPDCILSTFFLRSVDIISYTTGLYSLDSWFRCIYF